jgi:hypothetical protein
VLCSQQQCCFIPRCITEIFLQGKIIKIYYYELLQFFKICVPKEKDEVDRCDPLRLPWGCFGICINRKWPILRKANSTKGLEKPAEPAFQYQSAS